MKQSDVVIHDPVGKPTSEGEVSDHNRVINDRRFIDQLSEIYKLKQFLFEEKVAFPPDQLGSIDLGPLNNLKYGPKGRSPTNEEWKLLDQKLSSLSSYLDDGLRQRLRIGQLGIFFGPMPLAFLLIAAIATIGYAVYPHFLTYGSLGSDLTYFVTMVVWTITQGGLGACAYLAIQASTKKGSGTTASDLLKESFDITDVNLLKIRIILGSLFAFILGIAVCLRALNSIDDALSNRDFKPSVTDLALTLVPFLLGFSTNLVLAILDRLVESIRTFFGIQSSVRSG